MKNMFIVVQKWLKDFKSILKAQIFVGSRSKIGQNGIFWETPSIPYKYL